MIATLRGTVSALGLDHLVIDVQGVGYLVNTSPQTLAALRHGEEAHLFTELVVREDSMTLFGFLSKEEVDLFRTVQSVTGIGPKIAIAVLAVMAPSQFARAVIGEDIKAITAVPGIGPKGAKRLVLELKDKLAAFVVEAGGEVEPATRTETQQDAPVLSRAAQDVVHGLVGLGWPEKAASEAVQAVVEELEAESPGEASSIDSGRLLRLALRQLGGRL